MCRVAAKVKNAFTSENWTLSEKDTIRMNRRAHQRGLEMGRSSVCRAVPLLLDTRYLL